MFMPTLIDLHRRAVFTERFDIWARVVHPPIINLFSVPVWLTEFFTLRLTSNFLTKFFAAVRHQRLNFYNLRIFVPNGYTSESYIRTDFIDL